MTLTQDYEHEKKRVLRVTRERVEAVAQATALTPSQRESLVQLAIVPVFRYSAGLVPWTLSELEDLNSEWVRGYRGAWGLPQGTDASLFRLSRSRGGRGCPSALGVWTAEAVSLVTQCLRKAGVIAQLMTDDLQRVCMLRGCLTLYQLQRVLRFVQPRNRLELLMSRLDQLGLDATGTPWSTVAPSKLLVVEAVWPSLWNARREQGAQGNTAVSTSDRACVRSIGKLAGSGIWYAAQLYLGADRWLDRRDVATPQLSCDEYGALVDRLRQSPFLDTIASERSTLPGPRQLTLWESVNRGPCPTSEARLSAAGAMQSSRPAALAKARIRQRKHPWQYDPPLPNAVSFDLTSDEPVLIPGPPGWELLQRNGRLLVSKPGGTVWQLEAAQASMLERLSVGLSQEAFLDALVSSCSAQQQHDEVCPVHLSRHLLARLARVTDSKGLVGCRSVTYHPHFQWYSSPNPTDTALGAIEDWPPEPCVLLLDAFPPARREILLRKAFGHRELVWIVRLALPTDAQKRDSQILNSMKAQLYARIPKKALTVHSRDCWSEAQYDARQSQHAVEVWRLGRGDASRQFVSPSALAQALGDWEGRREDFHWPAGDPPVAWDYYREAQQDAAQDTWGGVVAAIDGSVERKTEKMGSGVTVGFRLEPAATWAFAVGGPLSSLRAEAAALHGVLELVSGDEPLLIFTDCLVLLTVLYRWGQVDYWPDPEELLHFDIIEPCIQLLRRRAAKTHLVKVKSHSGLLLNERADALAEQGRDSEELRWPGPRKRDPLFLRVRDHIRLVHAAIPDDNVPDKQLIRSAVECFESLAASQRATTFSREILSDPLNAGHILGAIPHQPDSTVRLWMQSVSGLYPTMTRLHQMFPARYPTAICPRCNMGVPETLSHFLTVCPSLRRARTEAHNRSWSTVMRALERTVPDGWKFYFDQTMASTGLSLDVEGGNTELRAILNWRPDVVAVNPLFKKVALLEFSRPYDGIDRVPGDPQILPCPEQAATQLLQGCGTGAEGVGNTPEVEDSNGGEQSPGSVVRGPVPSAAAGVCDARRRICEAAERKRVKYQPLVEALRKHYVHQGWAVQVLPWVAGVRGVLDTKGITAALAFLEIPRTRWRNLLRTTAVASVESLVFMHRVRRSEGVHIPFVPAGPISPEPVPGRARKRKWTGEDSAGTMRRWKRLTADPMRVSLWRMAAD